MMVDASVGISIAPNDGTDPDKLLKSADIALYRAKNDGRDRTGFSSRKWTPGCSCAGTRKSIRRALALGEFEVYYQPLITLKTERISGFEALLRRHHPECGMVPPMEFIPVAEEMG